MCFEKQAEGDTTKCGALLSSESQEGIPKKENYF